MRRPAVKEIRSWFASAVVCGVGLGAVLAPSSVAAQAPSAASSTSEPRDPSTSLVIPADGSTALGAETTTTALLNAEAGSESGGVGQAAFDPASRLVLLDRLATAQARSRSLEREVGRELALQAPLQNERRRLSDAEGRLSRAERTSATSVARTRESLRRQVVATFIGGDRTASLLAALVDPVELGRGEVYLDALRSTRSATLAELLEQAATLSDLEVALVGQLAPIDVAVADSERRLALLDAARVDAQAEVAAFSAGSRLYVPGFRFPVVGPVNFIDSWGFPRMTGTPQEHWHEGTDVMAPVGRELVAVEDGEIFKVGVAGLGGDRLWLRGKSGTEYYYAHLSAYGPDITEGSVVQAGRIVGYVGTTGNASGGAPHLHFEVHPDGGQAVNPYPLLATAWSGESMPSEPDALAGPGRMFPSDATFVPLASQIPTPTGAPGSGG